MSYAITHHTKETDDEHSNRDHAAPTGAWDVDAVHSRVEFHVQHNGIAPYRGSFSDYDVRLVGEDDGSVAVEGSARVASISGADENLYGHLQSPEFFDAEQYPEIKFRSTDVQLGDDGELTVTGDLTIRDQTQARSRRRAASPVPAPNLGGSNVVAVYLEAVDRPQRVRPRLEHGPAERHQGAR